EFLLGVRPLLLAGVRVRDERTLALRVDHGLVGVQLKETAAECPDRALFGVVAGRLLQQAAQRAERRTDRPDLDLEVAGLGDALAQQVEVAAGRRVAQRDRPAAVALGRQGERLEVRQRDERSGLGV